MTSRAWGRNEDAEEPIDSQRSWASEPRDLTNSETKTPPLFTLHPKPYIRMFPVLSQPRRLGLTTRFNWNSWIGRSRQEILVLYL